jgi:hypothetical protein
MEAQILEQLSKLSQEIQNLKNSASTATPVAAGVRQQVVNVNDILKAAETPDAIEASLKKPGNRDQYRFCTTLRSLLVQVKASLPAMEASLDDDVFTSVEEAVQSIDAQVSDRIKLIRMADRSECGWGIVPLYKADPIAESSDDEKRMKAAERSAQAVAKKAADARSRTQSE